MLYSSFLLAIQVATGVVEDGEEVEHGTLLSQARAHKILPPSLGFPLMVAECDPNSGSVRNDGF